MVSYDEIFKAYLEYEKEHDCKKWCDLWMLCNTRMGALVKHRAKKLAIPLPEGDIDDLITDATTRVMCVLRRDTADSAAYISKTFHYENTHAFTAYNRAKRKQQRLISVVRLANFFLRFSGGSRSE